MKMKQMLYFVVAVGMLLKVPMSAMGQKNEGGGEVTVRITKLDGVPRVETEIEFMIIKRNSITNYVESRFPTRRFTTDQNGELTIKIPLFHSPRNNRVSIEFHSAGLDTVNLEHLKGSANHVVAIVMKRAVHAAPKGGALPLLVYQSSRGEFHLAGLDGTAFHCPPGTNLKTLTSLTYSKTDAHYFYYEDKHNAKIQWAFEQQTTGSRSLAHRTGPSDGRQSRQIWLLNRTTGNTKWIPFDKASRVIKPAMPIRSGHAP